jgi:hypothetical protein
MDDQMYPQAPSPGGRPPWLATRARRIVATAGAGAVLVGSGVGIGVALTGGASAATGSSMLTVGTSRSASMSAARCARAAARRLASGHPDAARRLHALCASPALRLGLIGGIHGQVTFRAKTGFRTLIFERGTVESVAGPVVTVRAADGTTWTWHLVANSVVRENGSKVPASKLAQGEQVLVAGQPVKGANDARLIRIRPAA